MPNALVDVAGSVRAGNDARQSEELNALRIDAGREQLNQATKQFSDQERQANTQFLHNGAIAVKQNPRLLLEFIRRGKERGAFNQGFDEQKLLNTDNLFDLLTDLEDMTGVEGAIPAQGPQFGDPFTGQEGGLLQTDLTTNQTRQVQPRPGKGITVNNAAPVPAPPAGFRNVLDEQGRLVSQEIIPGGKEDLKQIEAERKASALREQTVAGADLIVDEIERSFERIGPNAGGVLPATGPGGAAVRALPDSFSAATKAKQLEGIVLTIKSNIGFDRLQQMRASSPTGGALGNVSDTEVRTLQATAGNLDPNQLDWVFAYNMGRLFNKYQDVIHGKDTGTRWRAPERAYRRLYENAADPVFVQGFKDAYGYLPPGFE